MNYWEEAEVKDKQEFHRRLEAEKAKMARTIGSDQENNSGERGDPDGLREGGVGTLEGQQDEVGLHLI